MPSSGGEHPQDRHQLIHSQQTAHHERWPASLRHLPRSQQLRQVARHWSPGCPLLGRARPTVPAPSARLQERPRDSPRSPRPPGLHQPASCPASNRRCLMHTGQSQSAHLCLLHPPVLVKSFKKCRCQFKLTSRRDMKTLQSERRHGMKAATSNCSMVYASAAYVC